MLYAFDGRHPKIEDGAYVSESSLVIGDVKIGADCYIGHESILRADYGSIEIGPGSAVEEGVIVHAPPKEISLIGKRVTIGHGAIIHSSKIGDFAVIGMGAILSIRSQVGINTIIAEGGVVKMRQIIPDMVVAGGNPAIVLRKVDNKDLEYWTCGKQLYVDMAAKYVAGAMERI